jgi:acid phosphatase type 7
MSLRFATTLLLAGCALPAWRGELPPPAPIADPCGTGAFTAVGKDRMQRAPYLQHVGEHTAMVVWAGEAAGGPRVALVPATDAERRSPTTFAGAHPGEAHRESARSGGPAAPADFHVLAARVEGLEAGQRYCYRIESDRGPLTEWATLTAAPPADADRPLRFVVIGDTGNGSLAQLALARRISALKMDAILHVGDLAYPAGTYARLQSRFFDVYADILRRVPVYAAIGNHDERAASGEPFEDAFLLPGVDRWYSFDVGRVHLVVLDTMNIAEAQAAWLERDLTASTRKFTIVIGHHPPYTSAWRGPSRTYREWFVPILEKHHVTLCVSGHEHHYERSPPIGGVTYIVSGGGGGDLTPVRAGTNAVRTAIVHHFLTIDVTKDDMTVRAIDIDGNLVDLVRLAPAK